ncbi:dye decolorizing peroxidase [Saccharomonospora amisosensis]|uniref:Dye decolorizing peroxidase n=1 Tax=Saccharomonospora amisosensis TaxID=1128677 RepID=A0A7X5UQM4_9PSEU|nr:Dyp-type peroxidase [Saccharomonospora amisosensis]NIJ12097.1 dye decolorizing peroxidase [Saccharomonospora amisosensis]
MASPRETDGEPTRLSRRRLLGYTAVGVGGAVAGAGAGTGTTLAATQESAPPADAAGSRTIPFHGPHQAGVTTPVQARAVFAGLDLREGVGAEAVGRLLRLWTQDAAALTAGRPATADPAPALARRPAGLTITFGFGPGLFDAVGKPEAVPAGFVPAPSFSIDRLQDRWSGGDLLVQVRGDDSITVAHAVRVMLVGARPFATVRWQQAGFQYHAGVAPGSTPRNLMGQVDGTVNPKTDDDFDEVVWSDQGWLAGGTTMILRRIRMDLDGWDRVPPPEQERAIGRRLSDGAPLTGGGEHDAADFTRRDHHGLVIPADAHIRRARPGHGRHRILRGGYNYDDGVDTDGNPDVGLLFASYQASFARQFVPIQRRLAALDALNTWTTPVGSAVFAIPPGCEPGGWIGRTLLES